MLAWLLLLLDALTCVLVICLFGLTFFKGLRFENKKYMIKFVPLL